MTAPPLSAWREQFKGMPASFRGVPFRTTDSEVQVGRRTVRHEFPGRDVPYNEDMGKRATEWRVKGYVLGGKYLDQRDALIAALNTPGPGELRHPRYGVLQVVVLGQVSIDESHEHGGVARFSIHFGEAGRNLFPAARQDTVKAVDNAAQRCDRALQKRYGQALKPFGPFAVLSGAIKAAKATIDRVLGIVRQVTSLGGLSQLVRSVVGLAGSIAALIRTPVVFAQSLRSIFSELVSGVRRPLAALQELRSMFDEHARPGGAAPRVGSTRAAIWANATAHADLVRGLVLTTQARLVSVAISASLEPAAPSKVPTVAAATAANVPADISAGAAAVAAQDAAAAMAAVVVRPEEAPIATAAQALALRDELLAQIDRELETNAPEPELAAALEELRAAVARDVSERAELLRERSTFTPRAVLPALVLAHRIYQDASRADELVARNGVRHPAFVPTAPLEVLR